MEEIKIDVAHKQITWPGEAPAITSRPVAGPRGQTELIDTSGWGAGDYTPLGAEVQIMVEGRAGACCYTLDLSQISASPSVFASAIENSDDPITAISNVDLDKLGVKIDEHPDIFAFEVFVYYMKTGRVNTAYWKQKFSPPTDSRSGSHDFLFQVHCILMAQKLSASRLVQVLATEIHREWLGYPFRIKHFDMATNVSNALDQFLVDWIVQIEYEKDEKVYSAKQRALVRGIEHVKGLRNLLSLHFASKPDSRFSALKFASQVLEATISQMQADACRAAMAHAKDVAGAAAKAGTEQDPGSADGGEEVNSAISDHGTKNDEEGEGVTKAGLESSQTTSVPIAPCSAGHLASDSTTLSTDEGTADTASQRVTLKLNRAKEVLQEHKNDEEAPQGVLRRSTRKRTAPAAYRDPPAKKAAKPSVEEGKPSTKKAKTKAKTGAQGKGSDSLATEAGTLV